MKPDELFRRIKLFVQRGVAAEIPAVSAHIDIATLRTPCEQKRDS